MDWANERYVRLYVRDSTTWKLIDWKARCTLTMMLRKVDRAGVLEHGGHGVMGLAAVIELPLEVVEPGIAQLTNPRIAVVVETPSEYVIPNYLEAQEASQTEAHRSREYRGRKRDLALARGKGLITEAVDTVTFRDAAETGRGETVTSGHSASQAVTPSLAKPNQEEDKSPAPPAAGGKPKARKPAKGPMPSDWAPNDIHGAKAASMRLDLRHEAEQFRSSALANGRAYADWDQAFHTWLGNAAKWRDERGGPRAAAANEIRPTRLL